MEDNYIGPQFQLPERAQSLAIDWQEFGEALGQAIALTADTLVEAFIMPVARTVGMIAEAIVKAMEQK